MERKFKMLELPDLHEKRVNWGLIEVRRDTGHFQANLTRLRNLQIVGVDGLEDLNLDFS